MNFKDLGLGPEVLKAIEERGYNTPTPIQAAAIPLILMTRDIIGLAQTGTGKTASFILPMIEILYGGRARSRMPRSLILEPTRELAAQVAENFDIYGKYHKLTKALLVGGASMGDQVKLLDRGVDVLIATPGRLLDLFERGSVLLNDIKILVIDEADRMLDMGFIPDIERIVSKVPPVRQTMLFSATMPPEIKKLGDRFLTNPKQVSVAPPATTAETVKQWLVWTRRPDKKKMLESILRKEDVKNAFIFCNRKKDVGELARWLQGRGYSAAPMHGDMPQSMRTQTLQSFREGKIVLMVCSDVAARGLDISGVSHVFNFDVPFNAEDYVHRIGRTGRAGLDGCSWTIAAEGDDEKSVVAIERLIKKSIPVESLGGSGGGEHSRNDRRDNRRDERRDEGRRPERSPDRRPERSPDRGDRPGGRPPRDRNDRPVRSDPPPRRDNREGPADDAFGTKFGDDLPDFLKRR